MIALDARQRITRGCIIIAIIAIAADIIKAELPGSHDWTLIIGTALTGLFCILWSLFYLHRISE